MLASFQMGGGKVDAGPCPDNLLGGRVIAWQRQTLCATVNAPVLSPPLSYGVCQATENRC